MEKAIVLASASPRRRELLSQVGLPFTVVVQDSDEIVDQTLPPAQIVQQLALQKARGVANTLSKPSIVIGADTIVVQNGTILGKPSNRQNAVDMLSLLSGATHQVYTGFAIVDTATGDQMTDFERTEVTFLPMTQQQINWYVQTGEPMDKAGGYGIQGVGAAFIQYIEGDYNNVVGLPVCKLLGCLQQFGVAFYEI